MLNIEKYKDIVLVNLDNCEIEYSLHDIGVTIVDCENIHCGECADRILKWLMEEYKEPIPDDEEPILDDAEKKYLSNFIKPFRDEIKFIKLPFYGCLNAIYTCVRMYDNCGNEIVRLPNFKVGTMYKGMELDRKYTLEELGL